MRRRCRGAGALLCAVGLLLGSAGATRMGISQSHVDHAPPRPPQPPAPGPPIAGAGLQSLTGVSEGQPAGRPVLPPHHPGPPHSGQQPQRRSQMDTGAWVAGSLAALVLLGAAVAVACIGKRKPRKAERERAASAESARDAPVSPPKRHIFAPVFVSKDHEVASGYPVLADASGGPPSGTSGHQSYHSSHSPETYHHSSLYLSPAAPRPPGECVLTEEGFGKHTQSTSLGSWADSASEAAPYDAAAAAASATPERARGLHTQSESSLSSWADEAGGERGVHTQSDTLSSSTDEGAGACSPSGRPVTIWRKSNVAGSAHGSAIECMLATQRAGSGLCVDLDCVLHRQEQLKRHMHVMSAPHAPELFLGRYRILRERRIGGQALVQFARGGDGSFFQYAIKFFNRSKNYYNEERMYHNPELRYCLPDVFAASSNEDAAVRSRSGYVFPPFLVMERGMSLAEWLRGPRDALAVLSMFKDCAVLLATLHAAGHVHRDLKPDNILLMSQSQTWRLIDVGIASAIGQETPPQCTLGYAAPEVVIAHEERRSVTASAALDVWALGVMVFEAFTRRPAVDPNARLAGCRRLARGADRYPWEAREQAREFGGSRARELVELCLARDAAKRPSAALLVSRIRAISHHTGSSGDSLRTP